MLGTKWILLTVAALAALALAAPPAMAQNIYKTVDENGNVVYTDQKPTDDAEPVSLPELTVVDPVELGDEAVAGSAANRSGDQEVESDFGLNIVSPASEETIWNTAYVLSVDVATDRDLPSGTQLAYLVDGEVFMTTRSLSVEIEEVFRGEHQLTVELRTRDGNVLASAGPVTFFMRQHSRLHPNPG